MSDLKWDAIPEGLDEFGERSVLIMRLMKAKHALLCSGHEPVMDDAKDDIVDLITNLLHLADHLDLDADSVVYWAATHYEEERE